MKCKRCGKEFTPTHEATKYCSLECRKMFYKEQRCNTSTVTRKCMICGKEFTCRERSRQRYCSEPCVKEAAKLRYEQSKAQRVKEKQELEKTVCKKIATCIYGDCGVCAYCLRTGTLRGGYASECTHYERRKNGRRKESPWQYR